MNDASAITSLYAAAPVGLAVLDGDLRWTHVNAAAAQLMARPREELLGRRPSEINPVIGAGAEECARAALAAGATVRRSIGGPGATGQRWFDFAAFPVAGGIGVVAVETTARMEAERLLGDAQRRDALLVRAGQMLSAALTLDETVRTVAELVAPELVDWCEVELGPDAGAAARGEVVPLVARGRELGRLVFGGDARTGRVVDPADRDTVRALADRAAISLDNAMLFHQRDALARSLQEELLPPRLPRIPGIEIAARYAAAGEGQDVGGDFYDLFASGRGWQVVIGDVVGAGPSAAAVTGVARSTMRAAGAYEGAPSQLLRVLNGALLDGGRRASVACVRLEPDADGLALTASVAGHPLPLLVGVDGRVRELGRRGPLLGVERDLVVFNTPGRLAPGELLVLSTDGASAADLRSLLATLGGAAPEAVLDRLEAAVLEAGGGAHRDDVALVAIRAVSDATGG